jgi:hypothetical protein
MIYEIYPVTEMTSSQVSLEGNSVLDGSLLQNSGWEGRKGDEREMDRS